MTDPDQADPHREALDKTEAMLAEQRRQAAERAAADEAERAAKPNPNRRDPEISW